MNRPAFSQILGLVAALAAGALLVNLSSPGATFPTRLGLWGAWATATATLVWAGGAFSARRANDRQPNVETAGNSPLAAS